MFTYTLVEKAIVNADNRFHRKCKAQGCGVIMCDVSTAR